MKFANLATAAVAAAIVMSFGLAACSSQSSSSSASASSASASASSASASAAASSSSAASARVVGEKATDATMFEFTNKTGKTIEAIAVKQVNAAEYPASMLANGESIASGETVMLAFPAVPASDLDEQGRRIVDVSITLAGDAVHELHQVDLNDIASADLRLDGDIAFLEYTDASNAKKSTLEAEKAIAQQKAEEAAAAEAPAETEPAEQPVYEDYSSYDNSTVYVDDSAVGSGDEAACIPDIVLR